MNNEILNRVTLHNSSSHPQKQKYKLMILKYLVTAVNKEYVKIVGMGTHAASILHIRF